MERPAGAPAPAVAPVLLESDVLIVTVTALEAMIRLPIPPVLVESDVLIATVTALEAMIRLPIPPTAAAEALSAAKALHIAL